MDTAVTQPMSSKRRTRYFQRGATVVEFALVLPLFVTMMMAIVEYGYGFARQQIVTNAAREGARAGALEENITNAKAKAKTVATTFLQNGFIACSNCVTTTGTVIQGSDAVQVAISIPWQSLTGFGFIPKPPHNAATAVMRLF
jgi:Flp pilus assembly protein TadG